MVSMFVLIRSEEIKYIFRDTCLVKFKVKYTVRSRFRGNLYFQLTKHSFHCYIQTKIVSSKKNCCNKKQTL